MPMVSYHATSGTVTVMMPTNTPQLTPLLVSNPADSFAASAPWFAALDPSAQGRAFSRRYGFMMDSLSDPLPAGTEFWIRKLSGPADLKFYNYSSSAPQQFDPVFGTDGTPPGVAWNGVMWHPCVTAPPGTNDYTATFEVYLADLNTGEELPNTSSGPLVFKWTTVPDGRPVLNLAPTIIVAWPLTTTPNWKLESAASADATTWQPVTNAPVNLDGQTAVILDGTATMRFFRMRYEP